MTATRTKRDLFGGTLRCAGLAAAAVMAPNAMAEFFPTAYGTISGQTNVFAFDVSGSYFGGYSYTGLFPDTLSYSYAGWTSSAYSGPTVIGASISEFDPELWNSAQANVYQWVFVQTSKPVVLEWDLNGASGFMRVYQYNVGELFELFIDAADGDAAGSTMFTFEPGEMYFLDASVTSSEEFGGTGFVRFTSIPAPSVLTMLGLGALGSRRRRRRL